MEPPDDYACSTCGVSGYKLWRYENDPGRHYPYSSHLPAPKLWCVDCLCKDVGARLWDVREDGRLTNTGSMATVFIGEHCPALPMPMYSGSYRSGAYFDYTNAPFVVRKWWHDLPLRDHSKPLLNIEPKKVNHDNS